jgi:uncharacterized membrane protein
LSNGRFFATVGAGETGGGNDRPKMPLEDIGAIAFFLLVWVSLEPWLEYTKRKNSIPRNMEAIRRAWMREVLTRDTNFIGDAAILGHTINSASFFASANLLVIMAVAGSLSLDPASFGKTGLIATFAGDTPAWLLQTKILLVFGTLLRGLSDFVWAVRQLNYCLAAIGSSPSKNEDRDLDAWTDALTSVVNPALRTFSKGVRSYYFTFAAILWFLGPWVFCLGTLLSASLMVWRHTSSRTAHGLSRIHELIEAQKAKS